MNNKTDAGSERGVYGLQQKSEETEEYLAKLEVFISVGQEKNNQRNIEATSCTVFGAEVEIGENPDC